MCPWYNENKTRNIEQAIVDSRSNSIYSKRQMVINQKRLEYSQQSINLAMLRFNNGKGILLDVIQAQSEATLSRVQYIASITKYNIAQVELLFNIGMIDSDKILEKYNPIKNQP